MTTQSLESVGQKLRTHWLSNEVQVNQGVSESILIAFEKGHGVRLPSDLRDYFLHVNGMEPDAADEAMIRFWMLDEVEALPTGAPEYAIAPQIENPESLFLFADYSLWAHAYAIRLTASGAEASKIFLIGANSPILLFQSFSELVDGYLANKACMFPGLNYPK